MGEGWISVVACSSTDLFAYGGNIRFFCFSFSRVAFVELVVPAFAESFFFFVKSLKPLKELADTLNRRR